VNKAVLDSSIILAILRGETINTAIYQKIEGGFLSAVNLAEILTKVTEDPLIEDDAADGLIALLAPVVPFTESQAAKVAMLRLPIKSAGLSLGDRACIALGMELDADIYTADRAWAKLNLPCRIHVIR